MDLNYYRVNFVTLKSISYHQKMNLSIPCDLGINHCPMLPPILVLYRYVMLFIGLQLHVPSISSNLYS